MGWYRIRKTEKRRLDRTTRATDERYHTLLDRLKRECSTDVKQLTDGMIDLWSTKLYSYIQQTEPRRHYGHEGVSSYNNMGRQYISMKRMYHKHGGRVRCAGGSQRCAARATIAADQWQHIHSFRKTKKTKKTAGQAAKKRHVIVRKKYILLSYQGIRICARCPYPV